MDNSDHYAVVIGLARYPHLGEPPPSDLRGPINDARAVHQWLCDPAGGGLLQENVALITSPDPLPPTGAPERDEIQRAFVDLSIRAEAKRNGLGALLGRRLYVYVSGHGFSPTLNQGCLLAGNAGGMAMGANVFVTRWLEQFQDAGYFFETVLWMDCCMNRDPRDVPSLPTIQPRVSSTPPGPSFAAVAARRPLRAVEQIGADGDYHGIFTTVLLEGLRGAAANPYGMVTGRSLADWLRNAQRSRLSSEDLADPRVSKEPDILKEDQALVFARGLVPATFDVGLSIPGGSGRDWRLWSGRPVAARTGAIPDSEIVKLELHPGLYVIEVQGLSLRQGFEVTGPVELTVEQQGPPVDPGSDLVPICVDPQDPTAEIYLVDQSFNLVDRSIGRLETSVPPAIYKTRVRSGDRLAEQVYLLDRAPKPAEAAPDLPAFDAAAPLPGTAFTHEYHVDALQHAADSVGAQLGTGAQILLMSRVWREDDSAPIALPRSAALELWDEERKIADLREGTVSVHGDPFATLLISVDPGTYFVRRTAGAAGEIVEQAILALEGWRTSLFFLVTPDPNQPAESAQPKIGMLMHKIGDGFGEEADRLVLQAQSAVGKGRAALTEELERVLIEDPHSPLAAILGGHLLILEQKKRPSLKGEKLRPLVEGLRSSIGPVPSGDVDALALAIRSPDQPVPPQIASPPIFKASWDIIAEASLSRPDLVPTAIYSRIFATAAAAPFNAWAMDPESREARRNSLLETFAAERLERDPARLDIPTDWLAGIHPALPNPFAAGILPSAGVRGGTGAASEDRNAAITGLPGAFPGAPPGKAPAQDISEATASKLRALGLPASALDL